MVLTAEQNLRIALLYEKAAADRLGVPPQQRTAFARKAKWFRMKARIRAKKEAALAEEHMNGHGARLDETCLNETRPGETRLDETRLDEAGLDEAWLKQAGMNGASPRLDEAGPKTARPKGARPQKPKAQPHRYRSIAERIAAARAAQS